MDFPVWVVAYFQPRNILSCVAQYLTWPDGKIRLSNTSRTDLSMRVGIAIDVSTDVSHDFVTENNVYVLPSTLHLGQQHVVYGRDPAQALAFYRDRASTRRSEDETTAFSVKEIEDLFLNKLALEYDYVFLITLSSAHSQTYDNAHKASFTILQSYTAARAARGIVGPFALRVVDSQSLFTGPGILAWEAVRMVRAGAAPVEIRNRLDELAPQIHTFLVPCELHSLRTRGAERGDSSVGWISYALGQAFDIKPVIRANRTQSRPIAIYRGFGKAVEKMLRHGAAQIRRGLQVPMVGISYGGDCEKLRAMPGFVELENAAREKNVELMLSIMSPAAAVNVGVGAVSLSYCASDVENFKR